MPTTGKAPPFGGGKVLFYSGLGLIVLLLFMGFSIRPIAPRMIFLDDGQMLVSDGYLLPEVCLAKLGHPLGENDQLTCFEQDQQGLDRIFVVKRAKTVTVADFNNTWNANTQARTVRELLSQEKEKFSLGELDRIEPPLTAHVTDGMEIKVTRVTYKDEVKEEKLDPGFNMVGDESLPRGRVVTEKKGKPGVKETTYRNFYKNGELTLTKKVGEKVIKPGEPGVMRVGSRVIVMSRSGYRGKRMLEMEASAYDAGPQSTGKWADGRTATGAKAQYGIVAVDPRVIPLGTRLFIEGYGYATAMDVGGAIKGLKIDLFFESRKEALQFGRRKVKVYVLN